MAGKVLRLLALALALQACSRSHPASTEQIQGALNSSVPVAAVQSQSGQTLVHDQSVQSSDLRTEKFKHFDQGIEVLGSGVFYHERVGHSETGQVTPHLTLVSNDLSTTPDLSSAQAVAIAQSLEDEQSAGTAVLKILPSHTKSRLLYQVDLESGKQVWIDAHLGTHIATLNGQDKAQKSEDARIQVISALDQGIHVTCDDDADRKSCKDLVKNSCQALDDDGIPVSINPIACGEHSHSASTSDASTERATENARKFLNYFHDVHDRKSFDGQGAPIISVLHVGQHYDDAVWYRQKRFLAYGDGDGKITRDYTFALDVAAHELTHGVIQASAGLIAMGETGALNESIADFFGKMVEDQGDWTMGTALGIHADFPGLRDLKDPSRLTGQFIASDNSVQTMPYPTLRSDEAPIIYPCTDQNDFCAVHFNATIPGHAWYGLYQSLGKEKAEKLLYVTLTHFLAQTSDFDAAALATEQACATLFSDSDCKQVKDILGTSGMGSII